MPDLLNYQPSRSAVYYTPPNRIDIKLTLLAFAATVVPISFGAIAYAKLQPHLNTIYLRGGAVGAAALAVALLALLPVRYGKVRIPFVAGLMGATLSLVALYVMWLVWVHDALQTMGMPLRYYKLMRHPFVFFDLIRALSAVGTWSYKNDVVSGSTLVIFWLGEAAVILAAGVFAPIHGLFSDEPICRECGGRCASVRKLPRFDAERADEFLAAIENRSFAALASHPAPECEDDPELTLRLLSCPRCDKTHILTVSHIAWYRDPNGRAIVKTIPKIEQLLITSGEAGQLKAVCEQIQTHRASALDASAA